MTDAYLMDAECLHGEVWYDCEQCNEEIGRELEELAAQEAISDDRVR